MVTSAFNVGRRVFALGVLLSVMAVFAHAQTLLYVTDGDSSTLKAIDTQTGSIAFTNSTTVFLAYPIAVRDTIALGYRDNPGLTGEYDLLTGALIGTQAVPSGSPGWTQSVDGAVNGSFNYTFAAFTSSTTVYRTDAKWDNATVLFTLTGSDLVGITFDNVSGNLWVTDSSNVSQYTLAGTLVSQFNHSSGRSALAYQSSTDTLWLVPNSTSLPLVQYSKTGTVLQSLTVSGRSGNAFGAEFQAIPEPSTYVLMALGGGLLALAARRRRR